MPGGMWRAKQLVCCDPKERRPKGIRSGNNGVNWCKTKKHKKQFSVLAVIGADGFTHVWGRRDWLKRKRTPQYLNGHHSFAKSIPLKREK